MPDRSWGTTRREKARYGAKTICLLTWHVIVPIYAGFLHRRPRPFPTLLWRVGPGHVVHRANLRRAIFSRALMNRKPRHESDLRQVHFTRMHWWRHAAKGRIFQGERVQL